MDRVGHLVTPTSGRAIEVSQLALANEFTGYFFHGAIKGDGCGG